MDLLIKQAWASTGSSGGMTPVEFAMGGAYVTMYVDHSSLGADTQSFSFQSAQESTGPWFVEASTQLSSGNVSTRFVLHVTGPIGPWVRPYLHSVATGTYNVLLIGVG